MSNRKKKIVAVALLSIAVAVATSVALTIISTDTLTVTVDAGTPDAGILVTGNATASNVTKYKLHAVNEAFVVTGLGLKEENGTAGSFDDDFTSVQITYPKNAAGDLETKVTGLILGLSTFAEDSIGIYVPKNGDAALTIKVTTNSIDGGADSGENPKIDLLVSGGYLTNAFIAVGQASGTKLYGATDAIALTNTNVNEMVIRKTKPTVEKASAATTLSNGENILYAFTVGADANENVSFKRVVFSSAISGTSPTVGYYTFYRGSVPLTADVTITDQIGNDLTVAAIDTAASKATTNVIVTFTGTKEEVVAKGTTNTYYLKATVGASAAGDSTTFRIADDITNLGSTVVADANFGVDNASNTAAWSTTKNVGAYSAKLVKMTAVGSTYVQFTPAIGTTGTTIADLNDITTGWSFQYKMDAGTLAGPQLELRFKDPASSGYADVTITALQAGTTHSGSWTTLQVTKDSKVVGVYGNGPLSEAINWGWWGPTSALSGAEAGIDADIIGTPGAWQLTRVRLELWEADARTCYIDDVTIAGVTYAMEPMNFIWSDNSVVAHTVYTADWTNAYLVTKLPVAPLTLSR